MANLYKMHSTTDSSSTMEMLTICTQQDSKQTSSPYFETCAMHIEERQRDLIGRENLLKDKLAEMKCMIPALIAYNMCMQEEKCDKAPYCKIRNIMKLFAPNCGHTEKLLENLKNKLEDLGKEIAELHESIIQVDIELEESEMQLNSIELMNREMDEIVEALEQEVRVKKSFSASSINSEDLACLSKIRQLVKEELILKRYVKDLEKKEVMFSNQINHLMATKGFLNNCENKKVCKHKSNCERVENSKKKANLACKRLKAHMTNVDSSKNGLLRSREKIHHGQYGHLSKTHMTCKCIRSGTLISSNPFLWSSKCSAIISGCNFKGNCTKCSTFTVCRHCDDLKISLNNDNNNNTCRSAAMTKLVQISGDNSDSDEEFCECCSC